ncbi:MAG: ATP-binding protein [Clostridiales bacterium]|jgi:hypothetical protein|nr:ATP-binding protein [Clostridiales bacterium]
MEESLHINPNPIIDNFKKSLKAEIYVDKSMLLSYLNKVAGTPDGYVCVSRPRRFGKTWAANMAAAYYSKGCNAENLFKGLNISKDQSFYTHLNKYNVVFLNIQDFLTETPNVKKMVDSVYKTILGDLKDAYPEANLKKPGNLIYTLFDIRQYSGTDFVFIIDEWDCVFRLFKNDIKGQKIYLDFLRLVFKDRSYAALVYMTGILPIKKYGTHSALNMFDEFSMADPSQLTEFTGFTELEVKELFERADLNFEKAREWYDGYVFKGIHIYNPLSVVRALRKKSFSNYWSQTETFEALKMPIGLNFSGLKDAVLDLMALKRVKINASKFQNDMSSFSSSDDVLTLLVHLGYLSYDSSTSEVSIPNREILDEFRSAVEGSTWSGISKLLQESQRLLEDTWSLNAFKIEEAIQEAHNESASILRYNDENSLCCVVSLAYYAANEYYIIFRELASGKGFIDLLFLPKPAYFSKPAILVELKWDKSAKGATAQIKEKNYPEKILQYTGHIILVGINYDKLSKTHSCAVEEIIKQC